MDSRRPLYLRIAVSYYFFACGCVFATWASRIPTLKDLYGWNEAQLGSLLFLLPLGSFVALPFAGWSITRLGSKRMTVLSTLGYAGLLGLLGYSASVKSVWALSVGLFFFGFWGDVLNIAVNTQALQVQEDYYVKPLMSSFHGLWSLGALTAAFVGGILMQWGVSLQAHFAGVALCLGMLAGALHSLLILRDKHRHEQQRLLAWPDRSLWLLGGICFCCALCEGAMIDWSSLYYKQILRDIQQISTTGFTSYALLMTAGRFLGDGLVTRLGYRGILLLNSFLIVTGLSTAIFFPSPLMVVLGFGLVGFGVSTIVPIVYTLAGRSSTLSPSVALAAVSTVGFSGFLIGPPLIGFLAHEISLRWALLVVALLGIFIGGLSRIVYSAEKIGR